MKKFFNRLSRTGRFRNKSKARSGNKWITRRSAKKSFVYSKPSKIGQRMTFKRIIKGPYSKKPELKWLDKNQLEGALIPTQGNEPGAIWGTDLIAPGASSFQMSFPFAGVGQSQAVGNQINLLSILLSFTISVPSNIVVDIPTGQYRIMVVRSKISGNVFSVGQAGLPNYMSQFIDPTQWKVYYDKTFRQSCGLTDQFTEDTTYSFGTAYMTPPRQFNFRFPMKRTCRYMQSAYNQNNPPDVAPMIDTGRFPLRVYALCDNHVARVDNVFWRIYYQDP